MEQFYNPPLLQFVAALIRQVFHERIEKRPVVGVGDSPQDPIGRASRGEPCWNPPTRVVVPAKSLPRRKPWAGTQGSAETVRAPVLVP